MCMKDGNANKGCYIPPETYLGIISVSDSPGCLVKGVTPSWTHPLWYDDMHLYGVYVCFTTQGNSSVCPSLIFLEQEHIIFVGLFIKIYNTPTCSPKHDCKIWLYSTLIEAEFNGTNTFSRTSTWLGKTHRSMDTFCIPSFIKANHNRE